MPPLPAVCWQTLTATCCCCRGGVAATWQSIWQPERAANVPRGAPAQSPPASSDVSDCGGFQGCNVQCKLDFQFFFFFSTSLKPNGENETRMKQIRATTKKSLKVQREFILLFLRRKTQKTHMTASVTS